MDITSDFLRILLFIPFGVGVGFMLVTNIIAFQVLRPAQKLGFLWWHVTAISLSFMMIGVVAVETQAARLGEDSTSWRLPVTLAGTILFMVAQVIIFNVERQRLVQKRATQIVAAHERE